MIVFESISTTFEVSVIFWDNLGSTGNWLKPKTKPPLPILTKLSLSKFVILTVEDLGTKRRTKVSSKHVGEMDTSSLFVQLDDSPFHVSTILHFGLFISQHVAHDDEIQHRFKVRPADRSQMFSKLLGPKTLLDVVRNSNFNQKWGQISRRVTRHSLKQILI